VSLESGNRKQAVMSSTDTGCPHRTTTKVGEIAGESSHVQVHLRAPSGAGRAAASVDSDEVYRLKLPSNNIVAFPIAFVAKMRL